MFLSYSVHKQTVASGGGLLRCRSWHFQPGLDLCARATPIWLQQNSRKYYHPQRPFHSPSVRLCSLGAPESCSRNTFSQCLFAIPTPTHLQFVPLRPCFARPWFPFSGVRRMREKSLL